MEKTKDELLNEIKELKIENQKLLSQNADFEILYQNLSEHNTLIENELQENLKEIRSANRKILDSVVYAQRIQNAMLPDIAEMKNIFPESFVFLKSKDIVSGDFYWFHKTEEYFLVSSVDCTGHGVPGAFMSIMGMSLLNEIAKRKDINRASDVLEIMRQQVKDSFKQNIGKKTAVDGMDLAFCAIELKTNEMQYSGAHQPLFLFRNNQLLVFDATPCPIGSYFKEKKFENHTLKLQKGDVFYVFSDGFRDQINDDIEKYSMKRFKKLLLKIHKLDFEEQKQKLEQEIEDWRKSRRQLDDILIIGIKI